MEDYKMLRKLGQGGQGTTFCVERKKDSQRLVVKQIVCSSVNEANFALNEAKTLQKLNHPSVVRYEDVFLTEEQGKLAICIVMEFCEGGDLCVAINKYVQAGQKVPEANVCRWMKEVCTALVYVHENQMMHRDLKGLNVFLNKEGKVKLGDFGLARQVAGDMKSKVGTPCYLAPEVLQSDSYGPGADIWATACIAIEMMTLSFLWTRKGLLAVQVLSTPVKPENLPDIYSVNLRKLVAKMLEASADKRPTSSQCLHAFAKLSEAAPKTGDQQLIGARQFGHEVIGGVANAVEAAKAAAQKAAEAAHGGLRVVQDKVKKELRPLAPNKPTLNPAPPEMSFGLSPRNGDPSPANAHNQVHNEDVQAYEDALARSRAQRQPRALEQQHQHDTGGYPLVSKEGLQIFISDGDLLTGLAPFARKDTSIDQIVFAALRTRGFFERYVVALENREMVEKRMREVLAVEKAKQAPQPRMQPPREDQANPAHRAKAEEKMEAEVPAKAADVKVQEINARDADALKSRNWGSFKIGNGRLRAAMKEFGKEKVLNPLIDMKEGFKQTFKPSDNEDLPTPQPSLNPGIAQPVKPADPHGAGMAMEELMKSLSEDPQNGANPPPHNIQNQQHQRLSNLQAPPGAAGSGGAGGQLWPGPESFPAPARNLNQGQLQSIRQFLVLAHSAVPVARQAEEFAASVEPTARDVWEHSLPEFECLCFRGRWCGDEMVNSTGAKLSGVKKRRGLVFPFCRRVQG